MWWRTVTHARRSEGEAREWSGKPVSVTWQQNTGLHEQDKPCRLMCTARLPIVHWTDAPADLGLVRFAERWNLVSARVPSHFKRSLLPLYLQDKNPPLPSFRLLRPSFTSVISHSFPSVKCFRRQFLRKIWSTQLFFLLFTVCSHFSPP